MIIDSPGIWRGPKPTEQDLASLLKQGARSVLCLQSDVFEWDDVTAERNAISRLPMVFEHIPMSPILPPTGRDLRSAVRVIQSDPSAIYVHCHDGVDRTGCVLWAYDVWVRGRPVYEAYQEMLDDGFHLGRYFWWLPFVARAIREGL